MSPLRRFLAVHGSGASDRLFSGCLRVIVHRNPEKAAVWEFVKIFGKTALRIKANLAASGSGTDGWYLTVPPGSERGDGSNYLAVTSDVDKAMPVIPVALSKE